MILNAAAPGESMKPESFEITPIKTQDYWLLRVTGGSPRAALWGALEAADQIISQGGPGAVQPAKAEPSLAIRGRAVALPSPGSSELQERGANGNAWRNYFDLLARNRFNSVFFEIREDLKRFVPPDARTPESANADGRAAMEGLHGIFRLARERGLNPYAVLEKSAISEWIGKPEASTAGTPVASATASAVNASADGVSATSLPFRRPLPEVVAAFARNYHELEGLAIAPEITAPVERRAAWLGENVFSPLAKISDKRPVIIGVSGEWWPARATLGDAATMPSVYLWARVEKLEEAPADIPVLWQVEEGSEELLPWQDPNAVREILHKLGVKKAAGFLEPASSVAQGSSSGNGIPDELPPDPEREWFRIILWGRLGYAPETPEELWEEQFATHFGGEAGRFAAAAAAHGTRVLAMMHANEALPGSPSASSAGAMSSTDVGESLTLERNMFRPISGGAQRDLIADALAQKGLLTDDGAPTAGSAAADEVLAYEARQTLNAAKTAEQRSLAKGGSTREFFESLQSIARLGLTEVDMLRAARLLAQYVVGGEANFRQQAIDMLDGAQKSLSTEDANLPRAFATEAAALGSRISSARNLAAGMQPWKWEATAWEVGTRESWQPSSLGDLPVAQSTHRMEMKQLSEFGAFGRAGWIGAVNQHLHSAFFTIPSSAISNATLVATSGERGSVLVAKTSLNAKVDGRIVLRVISDELPMVWVNGHRAAKIPAQQFPWTPAPNAARSLPAQLYFSPTQIGANEIVVATVARDEWPTLSVNFALPPDSKEIIGVPLKEAARFEGGVAYAPATESSPQAHLGLGELEAGVPTDAPSPGGKPLAVLHFRVRSSGYYRLRFWSFWPSAEKSGLAIALDGIMLKSNVGRNDAAYQKWHWTPLDGVFDLGPGEHTLAIGDWKRGAMLGGVEVLAGW